MYLQLFLALLIQGTWFRLIQQALQFCFRFICPPNVLLFLWVEHNSSEAKKDCFRLSGKRCCEYL